MMIAGHGIDLQEIAAIERAYQKHETFARRILTKREWQLFDQLSSVKRQMAFLAGRWAAKEAFSKAMGTGIGQVGFQDIEILPDDHGAPKVTQSPWKGEVFVSISHSGGFAQASVILEK